MALCPTRTELAEFLSDRLPAESENRLLAHVETCSACQQVLESLTAADTRQSHDGSHATGAKAPGSLPRSIGQYTLIRELGHGGTGVVYLADQPSLKRVVALKVIRHGVHATSSEVARFQGEAEAVARLQHPNIVQIHEVGSQEGVYYLALEYVNGGSLDHRLAATPQEARTAAQLIETLSRAVQHAHERNILHRDLKPANVLLQIADGELECEEVSPPTLFNLQSTVPKIADFGLAKRLEAGGAHTQSGLVMGTPSYMAPEQVSVKHGELTPAVDVYGLGAILYEMLTGRPPFKGASPVSTLEQLLSQEPLAPSRFHRQVPKDLETICLTCLRKESARRYSSALDLADDLRRFLDGKPIHARPVDRLERAWKWARRRPAVAGLSAAVVVVTAAALALVTWQWLRAEDEAEQARRAEAAAKEGRRQSEDGEARLALQQGQALCERGDLAPGLLWLARALERTTSAGTMELDRPIRVNLAYWTGQLYPPGIRIDNPGAVLSLAFDPADRTLLAGGRDGRVHRWDLANGSENEPALTHQRTKTETWVGCIDFSRDGRTIATAGDQGVLLWDAVTHKPEGDPLPHPPGMLWGMAFLPGGRLVTCSDDGGARVWDLANRRVVLGPLWHPQGAPGVRGYYTLGVSPDGQTVVTAGDDGRAIRWDLGTGKPLGLPMQHDSCVLKVIFTRDGRRLLTSTRGGTLHCWDLRTGRGTDLLPQGTEVDGLALAPDGRRFASASGFGVTRVWDTDSLRPTGVVYRQPAAVSAVAFSRDGRRLAMGRLDGGIEVVELPRSPEATTPVLVGTEVRTLQYTANGDRLMVCTAKGVRWVEAATGRLLDGRMMNPDDWLVECAALSPDGRSLVMGRWAGTLGFWRGRLEWWDPASGTRRDQTPDLPEPIRVVVYSPDGQRLFACCNRPDLEGGAALWDVATHERLKPLLQSLGSIIVRQAAFDPAGRVLLLACSDGRARLWDIEANAEIAPDRPLTHAGAVMACAFDEEGRRALTGCQDGAARLWDVRARRLLLEPLRHDAEVAAVAFSPDGRTLLTASLDGTTRLWDARSGKPLGPALGHAGSVHAVAFDHDGRRASSGGRDGLVRQWRLPPPPVKGTPEQLRVWAEVLTGTEIDPQGTVREISSDDLRQRRRRLQELGGPPQQL
jgi:WD40 repeat protein